MRTGPQHWYPMRGGRTTSGIRRRRPLSVRRRHRRGAGVVMNPGRRARGLIEPGHFRFSVAGETVVRLKARLSFVHRGLEGCSRAARPTVRLSWPNGSAVNTSAAHALAHSLAIEDAARRRSSRSGAPAAGSARRAELLYNHVTDLGALANDVDSAGQRACSTHSRTMLRLNASVTGHRLLRGAVRPGAVAVKALPDAGLLRAMQPTSPSGRTDPA